MENLTQILIFVDLLNDNIPIRQVKVIVCLIGCGMQPASFTVVLATYLISNIIVHPINHYVCMVTYIIDMHKFCSMSFAAVTFCTSHFFFRCLEAYVDRHNLDSSDTIV